MKDLPLKNKNILFFSPKFFGYEKEILREMEKMGANVIFHSHLPSEHPWIKGMFRIFPKVGWFFSGFFFSKWIDKCGLSGVDVILIVKGEGLSPKFIESLRKRYLSARIVLYLWDSTLNCKYVELKYPYVDDIYSFDPVDCEKIDRFKYRPLFFLNKYLKKNEGSSGNGLFFLGTLNGDRPKVICQFVELLNKDVMFDYWLFVRSKVELILRKCFDPCLRKLDSSRLLFIPMPTETVILHLNVCTAVLDMEHPKQNGLTMRTFEVIASGKKLITTNRFIKDHDFYDPTRICVIDRNNPSIPFDFLKSEVAPLSTEFTSKYSLRGWIMEILGVTPILGDDAFFHEKAV